jgi:hypothetical protein
MIHSNNTTMPGSLPDSVPPTPANSSNLQDNNVNTNISHNDENAAVGDKRYPDAIRPNQPQVSSINNQTQNYLNKSDHQYQVDNNYSTRDPGFTNNMSPKHDEHHQMGNMQSMEMNPNHNNPISNSHDRKEHHYKRDAALGAGAAGLAGHEIKNNHNEDGIHPLSSSNNTAPHSEGNTNHHYKRDAALGAGTAGLAGHEIKNHHDNQEHEGVHFDNSTQVSGDHHRRDAALGTGAAGVAGHEMKKHHDENKQEEGNNSVHSSVEGGEEGEKKGKDAEQHKKPLNTGGDSHRIAEQEPMGMGGLTGKQPVGEVNFKKL